MAIRIVQLGSPRARTRAPASAPCAPPRGVSKRAVRHAELVRRLVPQPRPSPETVKQAQAATPQEWAALRKYRAEMATPENRHTWRCWPACRRTQTSPSAATEDEVHCHRLVLRELLAEAGAQITP